MNYNDVLWLLSGDTSVMYELLLDVPEIVKGACDVRDKKITYDSLLKLSYKHF